jgi:uncharacterized coiled-coil protein SlyX
MLEQLTEELSQLTKHFTSLAPGVPPDPAVVTQVNDTLTKLKAAVAQQRASLEEEINTLAASMRKQAAEMTAKANEKPPEPEPPKHPWEEHQGLNEEQGDALVQDLLSLLP